MVRHEFSRMKTRMNTNKGNLFLEYTIIIVIVIAALLAAQTYVKRGISGRWRSAADTFGSGRQYEPNLTQ